ncbi:MAG: LPS assembly protein LptD [Candidatus Rokubacteria bacterium]|nr:LPS assembly protein LptD [Candidatus Rokubacteria bacterium]
MSTAFVLTCTRRGARRSPRAIAVAYMLWLLLAPGAAGAQPPPRTFQEGGEEVSIVADRLEEVAGPPRLLLAIGNAELTKGLTRLVADRIELNRDTGEAVAIGRVVFSDAGDRLVGNRVDYNLRTGTGVVADGSAFSDPFYHLSGERMERLGEGLYRVRNGVFTTCEAENPPWSFGFGQADADVEDSLFARNVSFRVLSVPLIPWIPFLAAPIRRERQSGFLFPTVGYSTRKGAFAKIPYYWAIDDSQDLTLSLDPYTALGIGGEAQYRYIFSERARGTARGFLIGETLISNAEQQEREDDRRNTFPNRVHVGNPEIRGYFQVRHDWAITPRLDAKIDANAVTDDFVARDYGNFLQDRTAQRAESQLSITQRWNQWGLMARALLYQDLTTDLPTELQRTPEIQFFAIQQPVPGIPRLVFEADNSLVTFVRDLGPGGVRLDLHPRFLLPIPVGRYFTVTPFVGGRATSYDRRVIGETGFENDSTLVEDTVAETRIRLLMEMGVDAETRATRVFRLNGAGGLAAIQHIVEPRVGYGYIFGENTFDLPQYQPQIDDIQRTSQIVYSLTNRINAKTAAGPGEQAVRWEMMRLVLAQAYNLLPEATGRLADLEGLLILRPTRSIGFRGTGTWNFQGEGITQASGDLYATFRNAVLSVGTRYDQSLKAGSLTGSGAVRLTKNLDVYGSTAWDTRAGVAVESRIGIDLHFQCWALLLEYVDRVSPQEDEVRFSVNLLGLGALGSRSGAGLSGFR